MTLHEAMVAILRENGGGWMDRDQMARLNQEMNLFQRPTDGDFPSSDQLRLRARKYDHIFECSDSRRSLIRLRP